MRPFPPLLPPVEKMRSALLDPLTPPAGVSALARDFLSKLCSPALAGFQIPSSLHSPSLGKESGFWRFLATLLPKHKELLISPRPLNMAFVLLQPVSSSPCPGQWSRGYVSSPSLSASFLTLCFPPCPHSAVTLLVSPNTTCKSSSLPLPVNLEFQTHLFPNTAGLGAPVSALGRQQALIPVVTLADTGLHCQHCP